MRILLPALALFVCASCGAPHTDNRLVVVIDGLRPDFVTTEVMPNLVRLGRLGVVFSDHHAVFPTVTRVNATSIATGTYPATHGLMGNSVYVPEVDPSASLSTGSKEVLEAIEAETGGNLLTAPGLGVVLGGAGRRLLALSSGTQGSGFLLNHPLEGGAVIHPDFTLPGELRRRLDERLGAGPSGGSPIEDRTRWIVDAYLVVGLDEIRPDLTILWMGNVDTAAHSTGIGTPETVGALRAVDEQLGRLEQGLRDRGLLERTDLLVTSDHGFSTHLGGFAPDRVIEEILRDAGVDSGAVVRAGGAIYVEGHDPSVVGSIVEAMQRDASTGAIFTAGREPGATEGGVPGTLSFELINWNHSRAGDILVSAAWDPSENEHGYAGRSTNVGQAGHGSTSPFEIRATLVAVGPSFRNGAEIAVPSGNADLAPTLLHLLGLDIPETMDGRVLTEAMVDGPPSGGVNVVRAEHSARVQVSDVEYQITARTATVDGRRYLDRVSVERR